MRYNLKIGDYNSHGQSSLQLIIPLIIILFVLLGLALMIPKLSPTKTLALVAGMVIFITSFISTTFALYILIFSMLLSPEIREIDVNPLLVTPDDVIGLDARVIVDREMMVHPVRPYAHLAIRPYPEEFVTERKLKDGTPVILRPIKPEDEPMWHELLAGCSTESIWFRFSYLFKETTHEMATRYCFIDYDREIGLVAEAEEDGQRKLLGVGRLVADMNHDEAEYAVLVVDRYQGHGLGGMLTDYGIEVATKWGVKSIVAETFKSNARALALFRNRGFEMDDEKEEDVVLVRKELH